MSDPKPVRYLSELAENTSHWLLLCHTQLIETKDDPIPPVTLRVLLSRGLIKQRKTKGNRIVWVPTDTGLALISTEEPRYLAQRSERGYTTNPSRAMPRELEAVSETDQAAITADAQVRDQALSADNAIALRRDMEAKLAAFENQTPDQRVTDRIRQIRRHLKAIDGILRNAA